MLICIFQVFSFLRLGVFVLPTLKIHIPFTSGFGPRRLWRLNNVLQMCLLFILILKTRPSAIMSMPRPSDLAILQNTLILL